MHVSASLPPVMTSRERAIPDCPGWRWSINAHRPFTRLSAADDDAALLLLLLLLPLSEAGLPSNRAVSATSSHQGTGRPLTVGQKIEGDKSYIPHSMHW